jgi:hypothetical protein
MAFSSSNTVVVNRPQPESVKEVLIPTAIQYQLNAQELALLINIIKQASFLGEHVEVTYNTVIKLQNQYLQQTK